MELTRRDALLVLAGGGLVGVTASRREAGSDSGSPIGQTDVRTLAAVAEVLYPSAVEPTPEFVETYVIGRHGSEDRYQTGLREALETLRRWSTRLTGKELHTLPPDRREHVLRAEGADLSYPDPEGTDAQQVRYYVVDDLLYALYATPKGAALVGQPNPAGYPGGTESYRANTDDDWNWNVDR